MKFENGVTVSKKRIRLALQLADSLLIHQRENETDIENVVKGYYGCYQQIWDKEGPTTLTNLLPGYKNLT